MKAEKVREMSADELQGKETELQEQLFKLRFQKSHRASSTTPSRSARPRRDIARVKTVLQAEARARPQGA